jgi:subtilisin
LTSKMEVAQSVKSCLSNSLTLSAYLRDSSNEKDDSMSHLSQDLQASGIARVIVFLKQERAAEGPAKLQHLFSSSELSQASALGSESTRKGKAYSPMTFYPHLGILYGTADRHGVALLRAQKNLVAGLCGAPPLSIIRPTHVAAAKLKTKVTWGLQELGAPDLWDEGYTGKGVLVGHLDTGVDGKHPALKKAIAEFAEFDMLGREVTPTPKPHDTDEHGTHTAATIAGRAVGGKTVGMAPGAMLASAIVIEGGDVVARVLGGMDWAVGKGVKILSMSLGFRGWWQDFLPLTKLLRARNVLPIFAVGNEGPGTSRSPGNYWQACSIGAADRGRGIADFSSSQRFKRTKDPVVPDIVAPGVDIVSAKPGGGYQTMDGTSMATPHVAGLAALLWEAKPLATVNQIEQAIFRSCRRGPSMDLERGNRGIPNGPRALTLLRNS